MEWLIKINIINNSHFNNNKIKDFNNLIKLILIHLYKFKIKILKINFKADL